MKPVDVPPRNLKFLLIGLTIVMTGCQFPANVPPDLREFGKRFHALHGHEQDRPDALTALFHWDGVNEQMKGAITRSIEFDQDTPIRELGYQRWNQSTHASIFFPADCKPNLQVEWIMSIEYESTPRHVLRLPVGRVPDGWRIILPICISDHD